MCPTCGKDQKSCPGHLGHIELAVATYHPMLFGALHQALRWKCFGCHRFRMSHLRTRVLRCKLALTDAGRADDAMGLDEELASAAAKAFHDDDDDEDASEGTKGASRASAGKGTKGAAQARKAKNFSMNADRILDRYERELRKQPKAPWCQGHHRTYR